MKIKKYFTGTLSLLLLVVLFTSCEDDYQNVGSDLVNHLDIKTDSVVLPVIAYTDALFDGQAVQTNGPTDRAAFGSLGVYKDPIYGTTIASTLAQIIPSSVSPTLKDQMILDSVVLYLPYYSTAESTLVDNETVTEYTIDSIYGNGRFKLNIYRSNYFLSAENSDDISSSSVYYSNSVQALSSVKGDLFFADTIVVSNKPIVTKIIEFDDAAEAQDTTTYTYTTLNPGIRINFKNLDYWKSAILDKVGEDVLFNSNTFKNYFRGIYLNAEAISDESRYFLFNLENANITLYYRTGDEEDEEADLTAGSYSLIFNSYSSSQTSDPTISVISYVNDFNQSIVEEASQVDKVNGEEDLYLKGGQGSIGVIDLFGPDNDGDGIPEALEELRAKNWMIREARLTVYVDQDKIAQAGGTGFEEPERLYIYNLATNEPLIDFVLDQTGSSTNNVNYKTGHLGRLVREEGKGLKYTILITEHIKALLDVENESPSTKLGLVVGQNIAMTSTGYIFGRTDTDRPNQIPYNAVFSPEGTIIYGSAGSGDKKLKLEIEYIENL